MKPLVLFITEKWCDGNPQLGLTNNFHNMFNTFSRCCPKYVYDTMHIDERASYGSSIHDTLVGYVLQHKPIAIFYCLLGGHQHNPDTHVFEIIKQTSTYQCIIWPDTGPGWGMQNISSIKDYVDLHVSWDVPKGPWHDKIERQPNHIDMWTPEDDTLYFSTTPKDIAVSFMGSLEKYQDRLGALQTMLGIQGCWIGGGQRKGMLSPSQYAEVIRRSKIGINFSLSQTGVFHQAKGRIFEYTACGSMLMDTPNPCTRQFFTPGLEYVEFDSAKDLADKVKYYLENDGQRQAIADAGLRRFHNNWTAQHYWNQLMNRIEIERSNKDEQRIRSLGASATA